jgi:hypothetical protein
VGWAGLLDEFQSEEMVAGPAGNGRIALTINRPLVCSLSQRLRAWDQKTRLGQARGGRKPGLPEKLVERNTQRQPDSGMYLEIGDSPSKRRPNLAI